MIVNGGKLINSNEAGGANALTVIIHFVMNALRIQPFCLRGSLGSLGIYACAKDPRSQGGLDPRTRVRAGEDGQAGTWDRQLQAESKTQANTSPAATDDVVVSSSHVHHHRPQATAPQATGARVPHHVHTSVRNLIEHDVRQRACVC